MLVIIPGSGHLQIRDFLSGCFLISVDNLASETELKFGSWHKAEGIKRAPPPFLQKVNYHDI
jgi:hypothetical protein